MTIITESGPESDDSDGAGQFFNEIFGGEDGKQGSNKEDDSAILDMMSSISQAIQGIQR